MKRFTATSEGQDRLGLVAIAQQYVDEQWLAAHMTPEQAADAMRKQFRRAVLAELEMIEVRCEELRS